MLNRKQLPLVAKLNNIKVDINAILEHCRNNDLLDGSKYNDIKYSANSKHQAFLISNEYCKTNFFTETDAQVMEGERYKQLYLTDFDETKLSGKVNLHGTNIFERTKRLDPNDPRYLPEADELNYGVRNKFVTGPFEDILNQFKSQVTRVRLAYLTSGFSIKQHVDYDPSYIVRYHIPLITNNGVVMGFKKSDRDYLYHMSADGSVYFFNSGIKHWVDNNGTEARLHLIIDTHGQNDLTDYTEIPEISFVQELNSYN
jgi:hypothetical protein